MSRTRFLTLFLTLALALATAPAVMAQEEEAAFDPASVAEFNEDEALIIYGLLRDRLAAYGVAEEDMVAAIDWMDGEFLSQERSGDDEFGQAEEDEPEMGDDEAGDSDG